MTAWWRCCARSTSSSAPAAPLGEPESWGDNRGCRAVRESVAAKESGEPASLADEYFAWLGTDL